jgi:hypothetical protein
LDVRGGPGGERILDVRGGPGGERILDVRGGPGGERILDVVPRGMELETSRRRQRVWGGCTNSAIITTISL